MRLCRFDDFLGEYLINLSFFEICALLDQIGNVLTVLGLCPIVKT